MYRLDRMDALRTVEDTTLLTTELGRALERLSWGVRLSAPAFQGRRIHCSFSLSAVDRPKHGHSVSTSPKL